MYSLILIWSCIWSSSNCFFIYSLITRSFRPTVYKLDRFSRNKYEMAIHRKHLKDNGVKILSAKENIPETPEGVLLESLLEGMNQYYSEELSQKTKRGLRETRIKGNYMGGPINYGYKVVHEVVGEQTAAKVAINEEEAPVLLHIFEAYAAGNRIPRRRRSFQRGNGRRNNVRS